MTHTSPSILTPFGLAILLAGVASLPLTSPASGASYIGSAACKTCHSAKFQQLTNSIHSKMIRKVSADGTIPSTQLSMSASLTHVHGDLGAPKAAPLTEITYVMGGWYKEESYIKEGIDPVTGKATFKVTKYEYDPIKGTYRDDRDGTRDWLTKCAGCHSTGYDPIAQTFAEVNVGCEACHGPGSDHRSDPTTANIIRDTSNEGCGYCHIRAESVAMDIGGISFTNKQFNFPIGYQLGHPETLQYIPQTLTDTASSFFPDGTSKRHRQQYLDVNYPGFRVTKHHANGVTCTRCHDPHTSGILTVYKSVPANANAPSDGIHGIVVYDNAAGTSGFAAWDGEGLKANVSCRTCHTKTEPNHVHYFTDKALTASLRCEDCHMPDVINVNGTTLRGALHAHTFQSMRPEISNKYGADNQANSCTYRCHQDKGATKTERALWAASYLQSHLALVLSGGMPSVALTGLRGFTYTIEATPDLVTWTAISTNIADANGLLTVPDSAAAGGYRFYRAIEK
jgi:hypothetical protein